MAAQTQRDSPQKIPELRLSLRDAMRAAVDQNPTVQLFKERIAETQAEANTQLGELLPNLSGEASYANRKFFLGQFAGQPVASDATDFYGMRAFLSQNLFSLSLIQQWRAAKTDVEVAGLDAEVSSRDAMATVALVYLEALRAGAAVKAREADVKLNQELLRLATERKLAGMATSLDVTRAQVQVENEVQRLLVAQNAEARAKLNLIRVIGFSFEVRLILTDELKLMELPPQTSEEALRVAWENRVELRAQKRRQRLADLTLSSVQYERLPSLSGTGDVGMVGNQIPDALTTHNLQLLISVPMFDGGQRESRISENRSVVIQEAIRTRDLESQVTLEVRDALITIDSARQQVTVAEKGLELALTELELARQRFAVGVATNIEVTNAQTSLAQARDNLIQGLFTFNAARVSLARAEGRLEDL